MGWWCFGMEKQKPAAGRDLPRLHGKNGEDGTIQGLFQLSQIPYVGCDTESSAICMDKAVTHTLLSAADIEQAHYLWFYADRFDAAPDTIKKKIKARLDFPVFVKPANAGSSVGVSKVERYEDLDEAIRKAAREDRHFLRLRVDRHFVDCNRVIGRHRAGLHIRRLRARRRGKHQKRTQRNGRRTADPFRDFHKPSAAETAILTFRDNVAQHMPPSCTAAAQR